MLSRNDWECVEFFNFNSLWHYNQDLIVDHCFTLLCYDCTWEIRRNSAASSWEKMESVEQKFNQAGKNNYKNLLSQIELKKLCDINSAI